MLHASEQPRIVRHDANRQKWIQWLPQTVTTYGRRERRQPRGTPHGHGPAQLSRTANASSQTPIQYSRPDPGNPGKSFSRLMKNVVTQPRRNVEVELVLQLVQ